MEDIDSSPAAPLSPDSRKRAAQGEDTPGKKPLNLKGTQFVMPTPPDTGESSSTSPTSSNEQQKEGSPAPSISTMTSVEIVDSSEIPTAQAQSTSDAKPPPAKRRKLTPSEKLEQAREKEAKAKEKAELKAKKEEEKARKEDEKRAKDEEKRRKAEAREEKKREKELKEQRKQDEKLKRERSQMRLGAFFGAKPGTPAKSPAPSGLDAGSARRKSLSLEPFDAVTDQIRPSASPSKNAVPQSAAEQPTTQKATTSDYRKHFLPFELPQHSILAANYIIPNPDDYAYWQGEFDRDVHNPSMQEKVDLGLIEPTAVVDHMFQSDSVATRGISQPNVRKLVDCMQGTSSEPIDLTGDGKQPAVHALQGISRRHLQFEEDVRPAYFGTYSKVVSPRSSRRVMVNPFARVRPDTDYDYDSEAEWEEPEEGEDIIGDEEDEAESVGEADEMDGFLDDEEDALKTKRKMITGDLQPACTGLCWEDSSNVIVQSIEGDGDGEDATKLKGTPKEMRGMRMTFLLPNFAGRTIDPFSAVYWAGEMSAPAVPLPDLPAARATTSTARPPLQERHSNGQLTQQPLVGAAEGEKGPITTLSATQEKKQRTPKPQPKTLSKEDLDEFKEAVVGSPLGKVELTKGLKSRFPKITMETIKDTLGSSFAYMGVKGDKKWKFVGEA